jgi:hydrogenase nickel incorporation protein HypA/HybF
MHEFSIAESLIGVATEEARRAGATRVGKLTCRIGVIQQVDDLLMHQAFELVSRGTVCEGAELCIERTFMRALCPVCGERFQVQVDDWRCPDCGAEGENLEGGDELQLLSLEAEVPDEAISRP